MKVLVDATHEVGRRTARVLNAESAVDYIGLWHDHEAPRRPRSGPTTSVEGYDIVVSDRLEHFENLIARAAVEGIPIVLWVEGEDLASGPTNAPVVTGANVGSALTVALQHHPTAAITDDDTYTVAWTEPGAPLRNGHPVAFPDPVGMSWAKRRGDEGFVAFRNDQWGGAVVNVEGPSGNRVIGVADHAAHLEALVLAATVLTVADGGLEPAVQPASGIGERLMNSLRRVELDFAVWRSSV